MPFGTDAWPLIANAEKLLSQTPVAMSSDLFGGYNNFWPSSQVFGVMLSRITSLSAMDSMGLGIPLASSISVILFYAISRKIAENANVAFVSSLVFSLAFPLAHFQARVTKETFAIPIYLLLILLVLRGKDWQKTIPLVILAAFGLVTAHHFASLMTIAFLGACAVLLLLRHYRDRLSPPRVLPASFAIVASLFAIYYLGFAEQAAFGLPGVSDWISAGSYQVILLSAVAYLYLGSKRSEGGKLLATIAFIAVLAIALVGTMVSLVPGAPELSLEYLLHVAPFFLLAAPLASLGLWKIADRSGCASCFCGTWIASASAVLAYAAFGGSNLSLLLSTRVINFIIPPLSILAVMGAWKAYKSNPKFSFIPVASLVAILLASGALSNYMGIVGGGRLSPSQGLYLKGEFEAADWVSKKGGGQISADFKLMYLLEGYYDRRVDVREGYSYLAGVSGSQPEVLFTYSQMEEKGYLITHYGRPLSPAWLRKAERMNKVYNDGYAKIYGGRESPSPT